MVNFRNKDWWKNKQKDNTVNNLGNYVGKEEKRRRGRQESYSNTIQRKELDSGVQI